MGGESGRFDQAEAASLLSWWLDAGIDVAVAERPRNWLKQASPAAFPAAPRDETHQAGGDDHAHARGETKRESAPDSLQAFHAWLRQANDLPLFHSGAARALPHGPAAAELMLISDLPSRECAAEGKPIGGQAWELTIRMLRAIGLTPEQAYVASLSCFPAPGQRIDGPSLERCAKTMRQHIALVAPNRILLLGDGPSRALLGQAAVQARGRTHRIDGVPAVATLHPRQLLQRPSDKAHAWRDLLLMMSDEIS
jgi:DNA polymerase